MVYGYLVRLFLEVEIHWALITIAEANARVISKALLKCIADRDITLTNVLSKKGISFSVILYQRF